MKTRSIVKFPKILPRSATGLRRLAEQVEAQGLPHVLSDGHLPVRAGESVKRAAARWRRRRAVTADVANFLREVATLKEARLLATYGHLN